MFCFGGYIIPYTAPFKELDSSSREYLPSMRRATTLHGRSHLDIHSTCMWRSSSFKGGTIFRVPTFRTTVFGVYIGVPLFWEATMHPLL